MAQQQTSRRRVRRVVAHALLVLAPVTALFGLAEAVSWTLGAQRLADLEGFQRSEFMRECRSATRVIDRKCDPQRLADSRESTSVLVFGGSSVQGYPIGEPPFSAYLDILLEREAPGAYRVHNFGAACRDSTYVRKCARRVPGKPGDVYVVYSGHNDFGNYMVKSPRLRELSIEFPWVSKLDSLLARSHFYSLLYRLLRGERRASALPVSAHTQLTDEEWRYAYDFTLEHYTRNLTRVIEQARDRDIDVVLATLLSNVSEFPYRRERWDAVVAGDPSAPSDARYAEGIRLFRAGRHLDALERFRAAKDLALWGRAPSELNHRIRLLAATHRHVHLVDLEAAIAEIWGGEGYGCDFFGAQTRCDQFHPNARLNEFIARRLSHAILALRGRSRPPRPGPG
jgi:hypothetical protein